jgi:hypothetical protein
VWEVAAFAEAFSSVAVFQHCSRAPPTDQQTRIKRELHNVVGQDRIIRFSEIVSQHFLLMID